MLPSRLKVFASWCALGVLLPPALAGAAAPRRSAPARVWTVRQDGTGDFASIQAALDAAQGGEEVRVWPGVYREALTMRQGVRLVGEEREGSIVEWPHAWSREALWNALPHPVEQRMPESFALPVETTLEGGTSEVSTDPSEALEATPRPMAGSEENRLEDGEPAAIFSAENLSAGSVENLTFRLGSDDWPSMLPLPVGVSLRNTSVAARDCIVDGFLVGIFVEGAVGWPEVRGNLVRGARHAGIHCESAPGAVVEENICEGSMFGPGIHASGENIAPRIARNLCRENNDGGVALFGGSTAIVEENVCEKNKNAGIQVKDGARPALLRNVCRDNVYYGILYEFDSGGMAEENVCDDNSLSGINVEYQGATPLLRRNICRRNGTGISYDEGAGGIAEANICETNKSSGIAVLREGTAPALRRNICRDNDDHGIHVWLNASGVVEENLCEGNAREGIMVEDATPVLTNNLVQGNGPLSEAGQRVAAQAVPGVSAEEPEWVALDESSDTAAPETASADPEAGVKPFTMKKE
jgi:parallel beta-helix repeat protein